MASGEIVKKPDRKVKWMIFTHLFWVTTIVVLILWWGRLLSQQGEEIARLQLQLGENASQVQSRLDRTQMMIAGESGTFLFLIVLTNAILLVLFLRDKKRSKSIQAFFASLTHELRTPLTSIRLQAETLRDIEDDPKHQPFIHRLLQDVERLEGQVQRSLELARLEGGGILNLQPIPIKSFIQKQVIASFEGSEQRIVIKSNIEDAVVWADTSALTIIFRNMIDNAVKYSKDTPARVYLQGSLPSPQATHYELNLVHQNSHLEHVPADLGELFSRGSNSTGAGVGLYLIKTLVEKMRGNIEFYTDNGAFTHQIRLEVDREQ